MNIKLSLPLNGDSHNSYPTACLEIEPGDLSVHFRLSDSDREFSVKIGDFRKMLKLLGD